MNPRAFTVHELAERIGAEFQGNPDTVITGAGTLNGANDSQLAFLANPRYRNQVADSHAGAIVIAPEHAELVPNAAIISDQPYTDFAKLAALFDPQDQFEPRIHPQAFVDPSATIGTGVHIGPMTTVAAGASIANDVYIGAGCHVGERCTIGAASKLLANVTLLHEVQLGERVRCHPGVVIGADGFGLAMDAGHWIKVPQLGGVRIGDDCEIGANTTIDRGTLEDTVLGNDVRLDNQIQIAHNVVIGDHTAIAGCAAVAGSATIGSYCLIGGGAGVLGHLSICDKVTITAMTLVTHSIKTPGEYSSGTPVQENASWRRNAARFKQLDKTVRRVHRLEKESK